MRKLFTLVLCILAFAFATAQNNEIKSYTLKNGMNVLLCEDHGKAQIYGAVCVHAGSKNDPTDNTGMAHYLEHIMFKGTDQIGTLDWNSEKKCLDEISNLYDKLHDIKDENERNSILLNINKLSNEATQYAIPNEVDVILSKMGGKDVNAFTGNDFTVYHNSFPSNQLKKWLLVYKERFRNPIFRLFQTELETVYEEYNMYQDEPMSVFMEDALAAFFGNHPYGRPVIGYPEHLKNPQPSAMQKFFNTYYHPQNMTLVLVGDFMANDILPLLEETLGTLVNEGEFVDPQLAADNKRMNTHLNMPIEQISSPKVISVKETPVKMGVLGYHVPGDNTPDALYLDIISSLLNNESGTGLLDQLSQQHKLLMAYGLNYSMLESGAFAVLYVPKILGQSHEDAEKLVLDVIDSLRKGQFSDELFEAVKMDYLINYLQDMESLEDKFEVLLDMVMSEQSPEEYYKEEEMIRQLSKKDIARVAQKYFADNYMSFRSSMGKKEVTKLEKPNWKPIVAQNSDVSSEFAREIEQMPTTDIKPQKIDFNTQVQKVAINDKYTLYASPNPYNDIFTLNIRFNIGTATDPMLSEVLQYVSMQGSKLHDYSYNEFQLKLQELGASMEMFATESQTYISISGFDQDMEQILALCAEKVLFPGNDESQLKIMIEERISENKMFKDNASSWGRALLSYAMYGENSEYIARPSLKEMKKWDGKTLLQHFAQILNYNGEVTYVGNLNPQDVAGFFYFVFPLSDDVRVEKERVIQLKTVDKPIILLASNKKFLQSNIYFYIPTEDIFKDDIHASCIYNEYMSGSMAGVIFQEIRELRSLGYSAFANFSYSPTHLRKAFLWGFLGTQSDKTIEGCQAMSDLLLHFPNKPEKFEMAKTSRLQMNAANYIDFREIPAVVISWEKQGYNQDPREEAMEKLSAISYENLNDFHQKFINNRPMVITIAGDKKRIDMKKLSTMGTIKELSIKDLMTP